MARGRSWKRWNSNGELEVISEDGSLAVWNTSTGQLVREAPANPRLADAMRAGDTNAMDETIAYGTQWLQSPMGQDYLKTRQATADEEKRRWEADYGLREDDRDFRRDQWKDQYSLQRDQFGQNVKESDARILDLERQYGLDASRLGLDFNKQSIEYAKTPRSWLDALDWERGGAQAGIPVYMQNLAQNIANPAFAAKGLGTPEMNSLGSTVASASGNNAVADMDPTKAITQIIKASPPSTTPGLSGRDAATVALATEIYKQGAGKVGEGVLESMDPDEVATLQGVFDRVSPGGGERYMRDWQKTRIPGAGAMRAYAA